MEITLQSNRKFIYISLGTMIALMSAGILVSLIIGMIDSFDFEIILISITAAVVDLFTIIGVICLGRKAKPTYTFNEEEIIYTTKKNTAAAIKVADIESMVYIRFKWYYAFLCLFVALLGDGSALLPEIEIKEKNNFSHSLGYFSRKDVERLKSIYGDLLTIK